MAKLEWVRVNDRGVADPYGFIDRMILGMLTIGVYPTSNGYQADLVTSRTTTICRGDDREQVKREAMQIVRDQLQQMRDAIVVAIGEP